MEQCRTLESPKHTSCLLTSLMRRKMLRLKLYPAVACYRCPVPRLQTRINFERRYYSFSRCTPRCGVAVDLNRPMRPYLTLISISQDRLSTSLQINDFHDEFRKNFSWQQRYLSYNIGVRFKSFFIRKVTFAKWIFASFRFHWREWWSKYHIYYYNERQKNTGPNSEAIPNRE